MAHYAVLNDQMIVTAVITGKDEDSEIDWEEYYSQELGMTCLRTSYNTYAGVHAGGGQPFRKNYAGIGYTYDSSRDAFIPPKPFASWVLDESSCIWKPPVPMPEAQNGISYYWDEPSISWVPYDTGESQPE